MWRVQGKLLTGHCWIVIRWIFLSFLSGGLSLRTWRRLKAIDHPQFYGVDLNSRFEIEPGLKDINKLEKAFELLR